MVWTVINDAQVPNWSIIPTDATSGDTAFQASAFQNDAFQIVYNFVWAGVTDTQTPGWGNINNSQTGGWSPIITPPAITWTPI